MVINACVPVIANASPLHRAAKHRYYLNFSKKLKCYRIDTFSYTVHL
ncbi:hypothetical protein KsCSTR_36410 [Candidatus Kuenenia stuttgartiensis]|uniref:Uncharacterized protein n=1 Tax=Kuenenia stuttgartiensis TaxID=174633 RepID=A0A6G7GTT0_KUEST|nr:hypothetical protein KsCSTR_36410 [Candidatus Kuenenia stuttgartiensis]